MQGKAREGTGARTSKTPAGGGELEHFAPVLLSCPVPGHAPELRRRSANQWALLLGFLRFLEWPYFRLPEASRSWNVLVFVNKKTSRVATGTHSNRNKVFFGCRGHRGTPGAGLSSRAVDPPHRCRGRLPLADRAAKPLESLPC